MQIQLINGTFSSKEALQIITQLMNVKIQFHENKIQNAHNEEDIKMREKKITQLQNNLQHVRQYIQNNGDTIAVESTISLGD
ncbi:MAG: hypothetical protein ABI266_02395 [Ginsengibacter sp.]